MTDRQSINFQKIIDEKGGESTIVSKNKLQAFSSTLNRLKEDLRIREEQSSARP